MAVLRVGRDPEQSGHLSLFQTAFVAIGGMIALRVYHGIHDGRTTALLAIWVVVSVFLARALAEHTSYELNEDHLCVRGKRWIFFNFEKRIPFQDIRQIVFQPRRFMPFYHLSVRGSLRGYWLLADFKGSAELVQALTARAKITPSGRDFKAWIYILTVCGVLAAVFSLGDPAVKMDPNSVVYFGLFAFPLAYLVRRLWPAFWKIQNFDPLYAISALIVCVVAVAQSWDAFSYRQISKNQFVVVDRRYDHLWGDHALKKGDRVYFEHHGRHGAGIIAGFGEPIERHPAGLSSAEGFHAVIPHGKIALQIRADRGLVLVDQSEVVGRVGE